MDKADLKSRLIHFDKEYCVVTKFPGENAESDIPCIFKNEIENKLGKTPELIESPHRLDMSVSGVQIIAFSKKAFQFYTDVFINKKAQKEYWAIVEGTDFENKEGVLDNYLVFNPEKRKAYVYDFEKRKSKKAVLEYKIFSCGERYSYLTVEPKTGRTHQIRAQLSHNGMHIKGDVKYGARRSDSIPGIRLFAHSIEVPDFSTGRKIKFVSELCETDNLWNDFVKEYENVKK